MSYGLGLFLTLGHHKLHFLEFSNENNFGTLGWIKSLEWSKDVKYGKYQILRIEEWIKLFLYVLGQKGQRILKIWTFCSGSEGGIF